MPRAARPHSPVHPSRHLRHISVAGMLMAAALVTSLAPAAADQKMITIYSDQDKVLRSRANPRSPSSATRCTPMPRSIRACWCCRAAKKSTPTSW